MTHKGYFFRDNRAESKSIPYWARDQFVTNRAAGAVNGTSAEPGPGTRVATDTASKLTIASELLTFAATGAGAGDPGLWLGSQARLPGKMVLADVTPGATGARIEAGWDTNQASTLSDALVFSTTTVLSVRDGVSASLVVGAYGASEYKVAVVMRASGCFTFIKGGAFTNWTLLYPGVNGSAALFPAVTITAANAAFTADNLRVPYRTWLPVALASDSFNRADGALGNSDGAGHAEANGGAGLAWAQTAGTWGIATNAAQCSALAGGLGFATLNGYSPDVLLECAFTRSAGQGGLVARYQDADNYLIAYHDGTNAKLDKVVAGVNTNLLSAAATYGAGNILRLHLRGTAAELYYNAARIGSGATAPSSTYGTHGLYTTNVGNTLDNFVCWPAGTEGQHNKLDIL